MDDFIASANLTRDDYLYDNMYKMLHYRTLNFKGEKFDGEENDLIKATAIDEVMYLKMRSGVNPSDDIALQNYIGIITREVIKTPILFFQLPIFDMPGLEKYIPESKAFREWCYKRTVDVINIWNKYRDKIHNFEIINESEKKDLYNMVAFFLANTPNKLNIEGLEEAQEDLVKYFMNQDYIFRTQYVSAFIGKFLGYRYAKNNGLNQTRIFFNDIKSEVSSDTQRKGKFNKDGKQVLTPRTRGHSRGLSVTLNAECLKFNFNTNLTKLDSIISNPQTGESKDVLEYDINDGFKFIHTMYHELRHQVQTKEAITGVVSDCSLAMVARLIMSKADKSEYRRNYRFTEIEKDANRAGWSEAIRTFEKYLVRKDVRAIIKNAASYSLTESIQSVANEKTDNKGNKDISAYIMFRYLDDEILKHPVDYLRTFPQLNYYYRKDGKPKSFFELVINFQENAPLFSVDAIITRYKERNFGNMYFKELSFLEKKAFIKNMSTVVYNVRRRISSLEDSYDCFSKFREKHLDDRESIRLLLKNVKVYTYFIQHVSYIMSQILTNYPELKDSGVQYWINQMRKDIDSVNNSTGKLRDILIKSGLVKSDNADIVSIQEISQIRRVS